MACSAEIISFLFFVYSVIVVIFKIPYYLGAYWSLPQILSINILFVFILHFITKYQIGRPGWWIDMLPLVLGLPAIIFIAFFYNKALDYEAYGFLDVKGTILAFSLAIALIILVYRRTNWAMPALIVAMLLLVRFQGYLPGALKGLGYDFSRLGFSFYIGTHGIFGVPFKIASTILISFIFFGKLFELAGGGKWFLNVSTFILGSSPGGIAKVAVMASGFFGMISGSPSANTASIGAITIPMMIHSGYKPSIAGAIESVAGTGGQFMPPVMGAIIFIMAAWLEIPYSSIAIMAFIPAILYYVIIFSNIHFEAIKNARPIISRSNAVPLSQLLKEGWIYIVPLTVLILFLLVLKYDPCQSVLFSVPILVICSFSNKEKEHHLNLKRIYHGIVSSVGAWLTIAAVTSAVGMIIAALTLSGLGIKLSDFLITFSRGNLIILLVMVGVASFILGMGLDSIPCYITVAVLMAPALIKIGVPDVASHLFVIYWGMASFFTPPVCLSVYVACGISGANVFETGLKAIQLGIGVFLVPIAFVLHPALLLKGNYTQIILTGTLAIGAAIIVGAGLAGYFLKRLNILERFMLVLGAILLIFPSNLSELAGFILITISIFWQFMQKRSRLIA